MRKPALDEAEEAKIKNLQAGRPNLSDSSAKF